jgi:HSP20 family protein
MAEKRSDTRSEQESGQRSMMRSSEQNRGLSTRRDPFDLFGAGPFSMMRRLQDDFDRLFGRSLFGGSFGSSFGEREIADWTPAIEAFQRGSDFIVRAEVPGLSREDLSVEVSEDVLTIRGERKDDHEEERDGIFRSERSYGSFYRAIPLPEGTVSDSAKANFKDGVLEIVIQAPSQEVRRGRRIEIGESASQERSSRTEPNREQRK